MLNRPPMAVWRQGGMLFCIAMIHLVVEVEARNHTKVVGAFQSRYLAEVYCLHKSSEIGSPYLKFFVQKVELLDGTPKMNEIVLSASRK